MSEHLLPIPDHIMAHAELGLEGIEAMMRRERRDPKWPQEPRTYKELADNVES